MGYHSMGFGHFLSFPNSFFSCVGALAPLAAPRSCFLIPLDCGSYLIRQLEHTMFISNNRELFHLW